MNTDLQWMMRRPSPQNRPDLPWAVVVCRVPPPWDEIEKEVILTVAERFPSAEAAADHVHRHYRHLEVIECRPWTNEEDGRRLLRKVPVQFVKFYVDTPDVWKPDQPRKSLLICKSLSQAKSLIKKGL